jgi:hypothetical protein
LYFSCNYTRIYPDDHDNNNGTGINMGNRGEGLTVEELGRKGY